MIAIAEVRIWWYVFKCRKCNGEIRYKDKYVSLSGHGNNKHRYHVECYTDAKGERLFK